MPDQQWSAAAPGLCLSWTSHMLQAYIDDPWSWSLTYVHGKRAAPGPYLHAGRLYGQARQALDEIRVTGVGDPDAVLADYARALHAQDFLRCGNARVHPDRLLAALVAVVDEYWLADPWQPLPGGAEHAWRFELPLRTRDGEQYTLRGHFDGLCASVLGKAVREYKLTTSSLYVDKYLQSMQVLFYLLAGRHCFGLGTPRISLDVLSVTAESLRVQDGVFGPKAQRAGQPKMRNLGDVPNVWHNQTLHTVPDSCLDEALRMICYWIRRAERDAYEGLFADPYGAGCPWNPSGQSRYDAETNVSVFRQLHAHPPELRRSAIDMMLDDEDDGYCSPWRTVVGS